MVMKTFDQARHQSSKQLHPLSLPRNLPTPMKLERITLRQIRMPLVHFFETSFSRTYERDIILVEVQAEGLTG